MVKPLRAFLPIGGMIRPRHLALLTSLLLSAACGGRSSLLVGAGDDGPGGSGATGGTGGRGGTGGNPTTGGGGEGGLPPDCSILEIEGPIGVAGGVMANQRQPALVQQLNGDVVVTMEWSDAGFPNAPKEIRHTTFSPWGAAFPTADAAPSFLADLDKGVSFDATTAPGGFALLMSGSGGVSGGLSFNPFFVPGDGGVAPSFDLAPPTTVEFVSHDGQGRFLFGVRNSFGPMGISVLNAVVASLGPGGGLSIDAGPFPIACAQGAVHAEVGFTGQDWLVVSSSGVPDGTINCMPGPPAPGPPTLAQSMFVDPSGVVSVVGVEPLDFPVDQVDLAPVGEGYVSLWSGVGDGLGGPLLAWLVDGFGGPPAGPPQILDGNDQAVVPATWDAGGFGDGFLVSWRSGTDQNVHVRRYGAALEPLGEAVVDAVSGAQGRPDVIGDPTGDDRALVAQPATGIQGDQLRLYRVGCP